MSAHPDRAPVVQATGPSAPQVADVEIVELEVRTPSSSRGDSGFNDDRSLAWSAGETAMSLSLHAIRYGTRIGASLVRRAASSPLGRITSELLVGALDALVEDVDDDWHEASRNVEEQLGRVISVVVPVVVESLDPAELMERIDVNGIVESIDLNAIMERVDVAALLDRIEVNALLDRIDVNRLLDRIAVNTLLERADLNALLEGLDLDALLANVDVAALAKRARIRELLAEGTGEVAESTLDMGRRQAVALDTLLARTMNRMLGRDPDSMPQGPPQLLEERDGQSE